MKYNSTLCKQLESYMLYKNNNNFGSKSFREKLRNIDSYAISIHYDKDYITKDFVYGFIESHENASSNSKSEYASLIRQFGKYLYIRDEKSYILPGKTYHRDYDFKPHIFTIDERNRIFTALNKSNYKDNVQKYYQIFLILKLLFSTGMRISEVLTIEKKNIDYDKCTILIENTKNNSDRLLPIDKKIIDEIKSYLKLYDSDFKYLFERNYKQLYYDGLFYSIFRKLLFSANIKHSKGGPRVHDIRHTFAVYSLKKALDNGLDIEYFVPILSAYMGHDNISSTYKYLHLTCIHFPEIREKINNYINYTKEIDYENL